MNPLQPAAPEAEIQRIARLVAAGFEHVVSAQRFSKYLDQHPDPLDAIAVYLWNMSLCESLYPCFQCFEVTLRNAIHNAMSTRYGSMWFDAHGLLHTTEIGKVTEAKLDLGRKGKTVDGGAIVSELTLGFWAALFSGSYEKIIIVPISAKVFPNATNKERNPRVLAVQLWNARTLRNRVFHHERVCHFPMHDEYQNVLGLLRSMSARKADILALTDRFQPTLAAGWAPYRQKIDALIKSYRFVMP